MGYYMDQVDSLFKIKAEKQDDCLEAIKGLYKKYEENKLHGSWVDWYKFADEEITLSQALKAWRWRPICPTATELDNYPDGGHVEEGAIVDLCFEGSKLGDDETLFDAIAPFVEDDSYIQMSGEDGMQWRWVFRDGKCHDISPKIIWE